MIILDVGCAKYGGDYSVERLLEWYPEATHLYGYDPSWENGMYEPDPNRKTMVTIVKAAAWTYDGEVGFRGDGLGGFVSEVRGVPQVKCLDLAREIQELRVPRIVLKLDCEGSEYELLPHLIDCNVTRKLEKVHVEWHNTKNAKGRAEIEAHFGDRLEEWRW